MTTATLLFLLFGEIVVYCRPSSTSAFSLSALCLASVIYFCRAGDTPSIEMEIGLKSSNASVVLRFRTECFATAHLAVTESCWTVFLRRLASDPSSSRECLRFQLVFCPLSALGITVLRRGMSLFLALLRRDFTSFQAYIVLNDQRTKWNRTIMGSEHMPCANINFRFLISETMGYICAQSLNCR